MTSREPIAAARVSSIDWDFSVTEAEVLDEVSRRLAALRPQLVLLFGSRATGRAKPDSDYDLLVVMPLAEPRQPRTPAVRRLLRGLGVPFDIIVLTPEEWEAGKNHPLALASQIAREGRALHGAL